MFRKWLSPDSGTGGGGNGDVPPANPAAPILPPAQNPPTAGADTLEQKLANAESEATRWKAGYGGLQTVLSKKDAELLGLNDKLAESATALQTLQDTHTQIQSEHLESKKTLEEREIELTSTKSALQRAKIIMKSFPNLSEWEADGDLPETPADASEEDITKIFKSFSDKLTAASKATNLGAGGGPPPPSGPDDVPVTAGDELNLAKACAKAHDKAGYQLHYDKYLELSAVK